MNAIIFKTIKVSEQFLRSDFGLEILKEKDIEAYRRFIEQSSKGHFMQSPEWGNVKSAWKWEAVVEKNPAGAITGAMSVLIRRVPGLPYTLMYAPRGPVCDIHDKDVMAHLIAGVRALAVKYKAYLFKIDPDVLASDKEFMALMGSFGFELHGDGKNFDSIQPRFVFRLNVEGKTEDEVFAGFQSKTRYNIRVAQKHDIEIKITDKSALRDFVPIMRETGSRDGFATRPIEYFEGMLDAFGSHARLYMAYYQNIPVAGTVAIQYGDKVWYLYGASSNSCRNMMPNYLLQWEMIRWAIETHCSVYDFRGVSGDLSPENPLYGLYRFKRGFNGDLTEFCGEFDLVLNRPVAALVDCGVKLTKKARHIKNRRHAANPSAARQPHT
jgi:peptidoglycan pentaglycine glycine transferase (the first glycine)